MDVPSSGSFEELERFRPFLQLIVRTRIDSRLIGKVDLSGVVQQTLLDAHRARDTLAVREKRAVVAWLRRALANNLIDELRRLHARGRLPLAEVSIEAALADSSGHLGRFMADSGLCPAKRCEDVEQQLHLVACLSKLPDPQRRAIELHRLEERSLEETATELGRTKAAVAGLLRRGLRRLRELMQAA